MNLLLSLLQTLSTRSAWYTPPSSSTTPTSHSSTTTTNTTARPPSSRRSRSRHSQKIAAQFRPDTLGENAPRPPSQRNIGPVSVESSLHASNSGSTGSSISEAPSLARYTPSVQPGHSSGTLQLQTSILGGMSTIGSGLSLSTPNTSSHPAPYSSVTSAAHNLERQPGSLPKVTRTTGTFTKPQTLSGTGGGLISQSLKRFGLMCVVWLNASIAWCFSHLSWFTHFIS